jgi:hypothetical protein
VHHDHQLPLIFHVDSSVEGGYTIAVYQVPRNLMERHSLTTEGILHDRYDKKLERPVTYLSKMLNKYEIYY